MRLGALLGEGATGTVYAAVHDNGAELAVKILREPLARDPEMVVRFRREAEIAQHLRSEFIAPVVSAGRSGDQYWIAYRRLHGETLAAEPSAHRCPGRSHRRAARAPFRELTKSAGCKLVMMRQRREIGEDAASTSARVFSVRIPASSTSGSQVEADVGISRESMNAWSTTCARP
jgi:hypothetical protein